MYQKAKSSVKTVHAIKCHFLSFTWVRQGINLSPVLFSLFLNDLNQFMSQKYNGLSSLLNIVSEMLSDDDVKVFLKLFVLLYYDFCRNSTDLQIAANAMFQYCNLRKLKVNPNKTKVLCFFEKQKRPSEFSHFYYDHKVLYIVDFSLSWCQVLL